MRRQRVEPWTLFRAELDYRASRKLLASKIRLAGEREPRLPHVLSDMNTLACKRGLDDPRTLRGCMDRCEIFRKRFDLSIHPLVSPSHEFLFTSSPT